jgi:signal transduction histidine kinase
LIPHLSERVLILAPRGRDSEVAAAMLREAGMISLPCNTIEGLVVEMNAGAGFGLLTEEALRNVDLHALADWLSAQPDWSDFPFILLTLRGGGLERNPAAARYLQTLGNVTFLERPFHPTTLVSLAQSARRARRRQYEARSRLEELRGLTSELEQRVDQRTAERQQALEQLHEAQKLEMLGQLTGGVAHDFNNLLMPIMGALDMLQRKNDLMDERTQRWIANAMQSSERARTLVQRLLGFARRQELQSQPTDVGALIRGMRDLIVSSIGPTIELHLDAEVTLPQAMVDPNQLELAVLNLCVNARDAMPDGGSLTIQASKMTTQPKSVVKLAAGDYVQLSVIDTGAGMDAETLAHAVEPFFSTKEIGRGTGLGLSMVHGLTAQLGGAFILSSKPDIGTRAELFLPVSREQSASSDGVSSDGPLAAEKALSILVVDDEELVRKATAEMLRTLGHEVLEADGGAEALKILRIEQEIAVVVTDYKMPRMDGAELARLIREMRPDMPMLLISGYTGTADPIDGLPRLNKPFGLAELARSIRDLSA